VQLKPAVARVAADRPRYVLAIFYTILKALGAFGALWLLDSRSSSQVYIRVLIDDIIIEGAPNLPLLLAAWSHPYLGGS
jgi:hypothetical protein